MADLNQYPYFDDYNKEKQYTQLLALPGRVAQAREFTQAQSLLKDLLSRLSNTIMRDGSIVDGCSVVLPSTFPGSVTVEAGKIHVTGIIHAFHEQLVVVTGTGEEFIGVKLIKEIITEQDDADLFDPSQGYQNYHQPGAHRLKEWLQLTVDDVDATPIYRLVDGQIMNMSQKPELDIILDMMARRLYDQSGSYRVFGMRAYDSGTTNANNIFLTVEPGRAYIRGYEVNKPTPQNVPIAKSLDFSSVVGESKTYTQSTSNYLMGNPYVRTVTRVQGNFRVGDAVANPYEVGDAAIVTGTWEAVTKGLEGGSDGPLTREGQISTQVSQLLRIVHDPAGTPTEYVQGATNSFTQDGNYIDWNTGKPQPAQGQTYYVQYLYPRLYEVDVDYELYYDTESERYYIKFQIGGKNPYEGATISLDYSYYLARMDIVIMDKDGNITVKEGMPDRYNVVSPPLFRNADFLSLCEVYVEPNVDKLIVKDISIRRATMEDLYYMLERISRSEYNQAITDLDKEAITGHAPSQLRGILTDGFIGFTKADIGHGDWDAAIDIIQACLQLTSESFAAPFIIDETTSDGVDAGWFWFPDYVSNSVLEQNKATRTMKVNPYSVYTNVALLSTYPSHDTWIETTKIEVDGGTGLTITDDKTVTGPNMYIGYNWTYEGLMTGAELKEWSLHSSGEDRYQDWYTISQLYESNKDITTTLARRLATSKIVLDEAITYMRSIELDLVGSNFILDESFPALADNLVVYFNGQALDDTNITPVAGYAGSDQVLLPGSLKADANGEVKATLLIPIDQRSGTALVELKNTHQSSETVFMSNGRRQLVEDIYVTDTHTTIVRTINLVYYRDPLAQTFNFDEEKVLTGIDLYFAEKDAHSVTYMVRDVVNGYPGPTVLAEGYIKASDINVPTNPQLPGTIPETHVEFDTPIYCEANREYCIVLITQSDYTSIFCAELGEYDLITEEQLTRHPYLGGVMFSSSNNSAWTAHQSRAMKFKLYAAEFQANTTINYYNINMTNINQFLATVNVRRVPEGCSARFYFQTDVDQEWLPLIPFLPIELDHIANSGGGSAYAFKIKAELVSLPNVCPFVFKDGNNLIGFSRNLTGSYLSRNLEMTDVYNTITMHLEVNNPTGTTWELKYSDDKGVTWKDPVYINNKYVGQGYYRYTYESYAPTGETNLKYKIDMASNSKLYTPKFRKLMGITKYQVPEYINAIFFDEVYGLQAGNDNVASGITIGQLSISGGYGSPTYTLVVGTGDTDNASFTIDHYSVKVGATALTAGTYSFRVKAVDQANDEFEDFFTVTVAVA